MVRRASIVVSACVLSVLAQLGGAAPAFGNRPTQIFEHNVHFACDNPGVTNEFGTVTLSLEDHSEFGASGSLLYWPAPASPESGEAPFRASSLITDQRITRTDLHFDAVLLMEDQDFNPVGDAVISADLVPTGVVEEGPGKSRQGNRTIRDNSRVEFFDVTGTVTLFDGSVFDITGCPGPDGGEFAGFDTTLDIRISDPSQFVLNLSGILVLCDLVADDVVTNLGASAEEAGTSAEVFFSGAGRTLGGFTDSGLTLTNEVFSGSIALNDFDTDEPAGDAVVDATFTRGDHVVLREQFGGIHSTRIGYLLNPTGTITFPTEPAISVDLSPCFVFDGREQQKEHRPRE